MEHEWEMFTINIDIDVIEKKKKKTTLPIFIFNRFPGIRRRF